jgi:hypothetical protein
MTSQRNDNPFDKQRGGEPVSGSIWLSIADLWFNDPILERSRSQWPHVLRRRSATARLLGLWFRIPPGSWMFVCCECCVLSGRGLCSELITRPEESYPLWCVVVCDLEISWIRRPWPTGGCRAPPPKKNNIREELHRVSAGLSTLLSCFSWFRPSLHVNGPFKRATIAVFQTMNHHFIASFNSIWHLRFLWHRWITEYLKNEASSW